MTFWNILYLVGIMIACVGVMQILPLVLSVGFGDGYAASLALSCAASVLVGLLLVRAGAESAVPYSATARRWPVWACAG